MIRIYLASPYSHPFFLVRWWRWFRACWAAAALMAQGIHVYSPIAHPHWLAVFRRLPKDWKYWQQVDQSEIKRSDTVWVLRLKGWNKSKGIRAEMALARTLGIAVRMVRPGQIFTAIETVREKTA